MVDLNILASGSSGNATIISNKILIDCGISFKLIEQYIAKLQLVLLTHIHGDHFNKSTISRLAKDRPTLRFGCCEWLVNDLVKLGISPTNIDVYKLDKCYNYGSFKIIPFFLTHDVENCGYKLQVNDKKIIYATDCNNLDGIVAKNYDLYLIEANFIEKNIKKRIKEKEINGEYIYEYRSLKTHLSKEKADNFIYKNIGTNGRYVYMHRSKGEDDYE